MNLNMPAPDNKEKPSYQSFADQFYLRESSLLERLQRDLRLAKFLLMTVIMWIRARKVRKEYARARLMREPFYVDRFAKPGK